MRQALAHCAIVLMLFISLIRTCTGASTQEPSALDRRKALSGATLWNGQPNAWDIEQDWRGDCWLVGVLSSIAYADPKKLKSIIQGNAENGHVGVTLMKKTGAKKFVVTEELMKKNHRLDSDSHEGNQVEWPSAMEEAFAMLSKEDPDLNTPHDLSGGDSLPAYQAIYGFDGRAHEIELKSMRDADIWTVLERATHIPVSTASNVKQKFDSVIVANHVWAIKSADRKTGRVTVRNPWNFVKHWWSGVLDKTQVTDLGHGEFEINYADFRNNFYVLTWVDLEQTPKPSKIPGT